jgi:hypothetical protein
LAGHVGRVNESRNVCRILVCKPKLERSLGRYGHSWDYNIKMHLKQGAVNSINLAYRDQTDARLFNIPDYQTVPFLNSYR